MSDNLKEDKLSNYHITTTATSIVVLISYFSFNLLSRLCYIL